MDKSESSHCSCVVWSFKVKPQLPGSKNIYMVLSWILLTHAIYNYSIFNVGGILTLGESITLPIYAIGLTQIIVLMLYPFAGIIGEVYWTRYKTIVTGAIIMLLPVLMAPFLLAVITLFIKEAIKVDQIGSILIAIALVPYQIGLALFQSNIIQFGTDQLFFAPTGQLSNFIHWSFWCIYLLPVLAALIASPLGGINPMTPAPLIQLVTLIIALVLMLLPWTRKHLEMHQKNLNNPIKLVYGVLKYAKNNKIPRNPSAFVYNDEEHHNRINFAKKRYGGPYTTEEVEDVKTFGRITVLFLSLFGFLFTDNTAILVSQYNNQIELIYSNSSQPRLEVLSQGLVGNFMATFLVILIGVPVYKLILCSFFHKYLPTMIKRMGIGLVCVLLSLVVQLVISFFQHKTFQKFGENVNICGQNLSEIDLFVSEINITYSSTFLGQYLLLIPQLFNGFSLLLTFLTALEFILAQSPRSMQGLLIGFWYALQSLNVTLSVLLFTTNVGCSYISYAVRAGFVGISLILYILTARWYKDRKRQESSIIKHYMIIENYTARNLRRQDDFLTGGKSYDLADYSIKSAPYDVIK